MKINHFFSFQALIFLSLQILLFFPVNCVSASNKWGASLSSQLKGRAVWMYHFSDLDNEETVKDLRDMGINIVFLSTDSSKLLPSGENSSIIYTQKIHDFIGKAHNAGIKIHAMTLEDTGFTFSKYHKRGEELIKWIVDFSVYSKPNEAFDGIHIDTEPHSLAGWNKAMAIKNWGAMEDIMKQYAKLLSIVHNTIQKSPVPLLFSPTVHWRYSEWADEGKVPSASSENLGQYVDFLVPMVYEITESAKIYSRSLGETLKVPTLVGVNSIDFSSYDLLKNVIADLDNRFKNNANYMGTAVFKFSSLKKSYK